MPPLSHHDLQSGAERWDEAQRGLLVLVVLVCAWVPWLALRLAAAAARAEWVLLSLPVQGIGDWGDWLLMAQKLQRWWRWWWWCGARRLSLPPSRCLWLWREQVTRPGAPLPPQRGCPTPQPHPGSPLHHWRFPTRQPRLERLIVGRVQRLPPGQLLVLLPERRTDAVLLAPLLQLLSLQLPLQIDPPLLLPPPPLLLQDVCF